MKNCPKDRRALGLLFLCALEASGSWLYGVFCLSFWVWHTHTHKKKKMLLYIGFYSVFMCMCVCVHKPRANFPSAKRHCLEGNCVPTCLPILPNRSSHRQCVLQRFPGSPFFLSFFAGRLCWLLASHGTVFRSSSNRDTSFSTQGRCRSALHFTNHDHLGETTCKQG